MKSLKQYLVCMHPDKDISSAHPPSCFTGLRPVRGTFTEVIILGSFPSCQSLQHQEYYGNPQNHFWKIIEALFQIDHRLPYRVRTTRITDHRIALWDVVSTCCRQGSADARIRSPVFNDLRSFFGSCPSLRLIVLNGSTAGRYFSMMKMVVTVPVVVLPSTSPANTRLSLNEKIKRWEIISTQEKQEQFSAAITMESDVKKHVFF